MKTHELDILGLLALGVPEGCRAWSDKIPVGFAHSCSWIQSFVEKFDAHILLSSEKIPYHSGIVAVPCSGSKADR